MCQSIWISTQKQSPSRLVQYVWVLGQIKTGHNQIVTGSIFMRRFICWNNDKAEKEEKVKIVKILCFIQWKKLYLIHVAWNGLLSSVKKTDLSNKYNAYLICVAWWNGLPADHPVRSWWHRSVWRRVPRSARLCPRGRTGRILHFSFIEVFILQVSRLFMYTY